VATLLLIILFLYWDLRLACSSVVGSKRNVGSWTARRLRWLEVRIGMSTLIRLARSRGQLAFDESPRVALKVFGARLALLGICVVVVGGAVIVAGAVPRALAFLVVAVLLGQAVVIGLLLHRRRRERMSLLVALRDPSFAFGAPMATVAESETEKQARERLRASLDQLDERQLRLLVLSLLAETDDGVGVDDDAHDGGSFCFPCPGSHLISLDTSRPLRNPWPQLAVAEDLGRMRTQPLVRMVYSPLHWSAPKGVTDFRNWFYWAHEIIHLGILDQTPAKDLARGYLAACLGLVVKMAAPSALSDAEVRTSWYKLRVAARHLDYIGKRLVLAEELIATAYNYEVTLNYTRPGGMLENQKALASACWPTQFSPSSEPSPSSGSSSRE
jgi:hypothetical protein